MGRFCNLIHHMRPRHRRPVYQSVTQLTANLFHGAAGTPIAFSDPEHNRVDKGKGMAEHQLLDLGVGAATPMAADQVSVVKTFGTVEGII